MNLIRMIKLFGWEPKVSEQLAEKREVELKYQFKFRMLELANGNFNFVLPLVFMLVSYAVFTLVMEQPLSGVFPATNGMRTR